MARQPFYGRGPGPAIARMDMNAATAPGRLYGQMYANLGKQVGDTIEEYGLNKEKRAKLTGEIEAYYDQNKDALAQIGMSGDEVQDKKDFSQRDKFVKGDMSMAELEGYAGKLARGDVLKNQAAQNETRAIANELGRVNLGITKELKDTRINIEKDKGILSDLATKLAVELNPEKKKLLQAQMSDAIKNFGLGDQRRELEKATIDSALDNLDYKTDEERQAALLSSATSRAGIGLVDPRAEATKAALTTSVMANEQKQNLMPGDTSNLIKKQDLDSTNIDITQSTIEQGGGVQGMAERNIKKDDLGIKAQEIGIKSKKKYMNYLDAMAIKAATKSPENTSIENSITEVKKEIDSIMSSPSFVRDEDGNAVDIEDLVTITPITGEVEISEDANKFSKREINRLVELVKKKTNLRLRQKTIIIDGNGNQKEVTIADKERMTRAKEAQLEAIEEARLRKEREESLKEAEMIRLLF